MPLLAIGAAIAKRALPAIGRAVLGAGKKLGAKTVGGAIARTAGATAATAVAGRLVTTRSPIPQLPAGFAPQGVPRAPVPQRGPVRRTIERILPGGRSGREFTPASDTTDKYGRPVAVFPEVADRLVAPAGYVIVYPYATAEDKGEPVAMLKGAARSMGLWSARPKPPVSGWDMRAINRAHSAQRRVKKLAGKVGFTCAKKGRKC